MQNILDPQKSSMEFHQTILRKDDKMYHGANHCNEEKGG